MSNHKNSNVDRMNKVLIQWECQQLLNRVMSLTDTCSWQELADCYTKDATLYRPSNATVAIKGRQSILESFTERAARVTNHMLSNCVFEVLSETSVRATSRVLLITGENDGSAVATADSKIMIGGFIDDLVLTDGTWFISQRKGSVNLKYNP